MGFIKDIIRRIFKSSSIEIDGEFINSKEVNYFTIEYNKTQGKKLLEIDKVIFKFYYDSFGLPYCIVIKCKELSKEYWFKRLDPQLQEVLHKFKLRDFYWVPANYFKKNIFMERKLFVNMRNVSSLNVFKKSINVTFKNGQKLDYNSENNVDKDFWVYQAKSHGIKNIMIGD